MTELRRQAGWQTVFFTLKDPESGACLSAAMPRGQFDALRLDLANGERVHVYGRPELWTQKGELRLRALSIERFGIGEHLAALERLKAKLAAEGLFAESRKRPLPRLPRRIGLVTGNDAAAKRDVLTAIQTRFPPARVLVAETLVQGQRAAAAMVEALRRDLRRAGGRRRRPRPRRRQLRGSAPVQRRAARACGRRVPRAGRHRRRPRAGHAALRPRRRPARLDADRGRPARRPRPGRAARRARRAATALARGTRRTLERHSQRLGRAARAAAPRAAPCSSSAAGPRSPRPAGRLRALSPRATLERGYAIVRRDGELVRSAGVGRARRRRSRSRSPTARSERASNDVRGGREGARRRSSSGSSAATPASTRRSSSGSAARSSTASAPRSSRRPRGGSRSWRSGSTRRVPTG